MTRVRELPDMSPRRGAVPVGAKAAVLALGLGLVAGASCASPERDGAVETKAVQIAAVTPGGEPGDLDVLFMIDDSSGMASMQTKLATEMRAFIDALESLPNGLPNIHIAVVSSDLGAPGDATSVTCTTAGDQGLFRLAPSCASSTLADGDTYLSNIGGNANYTDNLADVLACITPLGETGCGFGHQLGSIARALGADGAPAPARNAGFLRPEADLAIIILSDADDCSAPPTTDLYSLNSGKNNIANEFGPLTRYRCNEFGHLCIDPSGDPQRLIQPPATAPADAQGTPSAPTLTLTDCESLDDDGLLTPVSTLVSGLKALKPELDQQIFVGAIVAPAAPYTVDWVPPVGGQNLRQGELWPQIEDACASGDGSAGEPAVRINQLVQGFGDHGLSTSICNPSYVSLLAGLAAKIGAHLQGGAADGGTPEGGAADGGGDAVAIDGGPGLPGGDGLKGDVGGGGSSSSDKPHSGLTSGGCDIGGSAPSGWSLTLLFALLIAGRRRRRGARRASRPTWRGSVAASSRPSACLAGCVALVPLVSCAPPERGAAADTKRAAITSTDAGASDRNVDILFMIDNSSEMTSMQKKLALQMPTFVQALESLSDGLPNLHIAVISSDLGAPGDSTTALLCTAAGDQGRFQVGAGCTTSPLAPGATFISNVDGAANYTGNLGDALACVTVLGDQGCGFEHQLGSIARALGADGAPMPVENAGFLRPDAELAIIVLSNEDDCSAPSMTPLYSLNGEPENLTNSLGPLANYRCNEFGHLCLDPAGDPQRPIQPPETPPSDAQGTSAAPTLNLTSCESLDTDGLLTPVSALISGIKALKKDPDRQIVVGAIIAPPTPYTVAWVAPESGQNLRPGELWPQMEHSCGAGSSVNPLGQVSTDGSWGDPAVRIAQWVKGFGDNGVVTSVCDANYAGAFGAIAAQIAAHLPDGSVTTGAGGAVGAGTPAADAGELGATGAGGTTGIPEAEGSTPVGLNGQRGTSGLRDGGCDIGASGSGSSGLVLAGLFLLRARRRRRTSIGSAAPGAEWRFRPPLLRRATGRS